mgnify:CR=1 FL=1
MFETSIKDQNTVEIEATGLSSDGSGVGRDESGLTTFVFGLLPGEIGLVRIYERKKKWQRGELKKDFKTKPLSNFSSLFRIRSLRRLPAAAYEL